MIEEILSLVQKHEQWRGKECLNLIASENLMSSAVRALLSSELGHRYTARDRFYMGTKFIDEIEQYGENLAKEVFKAESADLRPLSGHIADLIFLATFSKSNDTLMCVSPENGGYPGMWKNGLARLFNLKTCSFPFSKLDLNVKVEDAKKIITRVKPKIVVFGASMIPFPHPVKELAQVILENGGCVGYDGSHVMGLIACEEFQEPLREGASVLFGSTHKSFFGPQGGIILADKDHGEVMKKKIYPVFVDNAHWNRIASLTLALAEMKKFGKTYTEHVINNSKILAKALNDYAFPIVGQHLGFTESHQILLDYGSLFQDNFNKQSSGISEKLQRTNIIVDCKIRIGVCEVTRRGMKEKEMLKIAELIKRTIIDDEPPRNIRKEVAKLCNEFQKIEYCFES